MGLKAYCEDMFFFFLLQTEFRGVESSCISGFVFTQLCVTFISYLIVFSLQFSSEVASTCANCNNVFLFYFVVCKQSRNDLMSADPGQY